MRRLIAALLAWPIVVVPALAQTPPTPNFSSIVLVPGGTPSPLTNGQCWTTSSGFFCRVAGVTTGPYASSTGLVSTTGSPASGNLTKFSGGSSITNGDLSGDATTSGTLVVSIGNLSHVSNGSLANAGLANASTTVNGQSCVLGSSCTVSAASTGITVGSTSISSGTTGRVLYDNSGFLGELTTLGSGSVVLGTSPTIAGLTVTGSLTATGLVTNADLANAATTVNGQTCTLGATCTVTASAGTITVGTTTVAGGTNGRVLYDNSGVLGELTSVGTVTSVAASVPGGFSIGGSPVTTSGTLAIGASGTSGGVLAYTGTTTMASSGLLAANGLVLGGGAGTAPATAAGLTTDGASVLTLGVAGSSVGGLALNNATSGTVTSQPVTGALGTVTLSAPARTATLGTTSGSLTSGNCAKFDASGNIVDSGAGCGTGSGSVTSVATSGGLTGGTITTTGTISCIDAGSSTKGCPTPDGTSSHFLNGAGGWTTPAGTGVTAVSVATANGFAGSSSGGATPALTLSTSITGALKGNGTAVSQAACSDLSNGATGCSTATGTSGATIPLLNGTNVWSAQQSGSITTLAISTATFTPDGTNNNYKLTLVHASCPCTLANPSATPVAGTSGVIQVIQSATGSDLITTWGSQYEAPGGTASITLSTGANALDVLSYFVVDSTHILLMPGLNFSH